MSPNNRDVDFFPQSYMHDIAKDQEKFNELIKKIIKDKETGKELQSYDSFTAQNQIDITTNVAQLFKIKKSIDLLSKEGKEKGDKSGIEREIKVIEEKIDTLKAHSQLSEEELLKYNLLIKSNFEKEEIINRIDKDFKIIEELKSKELFNQNFGYEFSALSDELKTKISEDYVALKTIVIAQWENALSTQQKELTKQKSTIEIEIEKEKSTELFKKGQKSVTENKEYKELEEKLKEERKNLAAITDVETKIKAEAEQLRLLKTKVSEMNRAFYVKACNLIEKKLSFDNIEITPKIEYRKHALKYFLENRHNRRSYENQNYYEEIAQSINDDNFFTKIMEYLDYALKGEIEYKNYNEPINVTSELLSTNWFDISFEVKYENDLFATMSQGKKSFVVLKLLLEFSDKKCPILIDQPEDSLDNRAIYNELVRYIKEKKKDRQIILVTHNPNVVISADAEQIIVANQHGENSKNENEIKFQYTTGALENTSRKDSTNRIILNSQGIREHVCEILEGGEEAFEKREQKYGFK